MKKHRSQQVVFLLIIIAVWLGFLFRDAYIMHQKVEKKNNVPDTISQNQEISEIENDVAQDNSGIQTEQSIESLVAKKINTQEAAQDLKDLEKIYNQKKSIDVLEKIVQKQVQNYEFNEAIKNIAIIKENGGNIDPNLHLQAYLNSSNISVNKPESIKTILPIMQDYVNENKLNRDDYIFFQGLIEIRGKNYPKALELRKTSQTTNYSATIQSFQKAIHKNDNLLSMSPYYQDGLVALAALKNGYFTLARKLALETAFKEEKYILPYQILAYSHFLTNNRDTAIEYFLKLGKFDNNNQGLYQFLIGISYYRNHDYTSSTLYLSQVDTQELQSDKLRYLLLNYLALDDVPKANLLRQKLLGQSDLNRSDFYTYFYTVFYKAYFSHNKSFYNENPQLPILFLEKCNELLTGDTNICLFGEAGKNMLEGHGQKSETALLKLAKEYKQSYLYHMLGDYYTQTNNATIAKENYAKALSLSEDPAEKSIINEKLSNL